MITARDPRPPEASVHYCRPSFHSTTWRVRANKIMDQMQKGFYVYSGETWTPNVNLYETADRYFRLRRSGRRRKGKD